MSKKLKFESVKNFYKDVAEFVPNDAELERKSTQAELTADDNLTLNAVFTAVSTDRDGDIVYPLGCVSDFYNGVICWNHELSALPIGRCDDFKITDAGIEGKIKLASEYAFARDVYGLVKEGILSGISIGFIPMAEVIKGTRAFTDFVAKTGIKISEATERIITKWEWLETSICPVGCNRHALIYGLASKSITISDDRMEKALDLGREETKSMIDLASKYTETQKALDSVKTALESIQAKAATTIAPNPAELTWQAYSKLLSKDEAALTDSLNGIWATAKIDVSKIDTAKPIADVSADVTSILGNAGKQADTLTRAQVEKIADHIFAGYRTGYDGITPIREIEKIDEWRNQFVADFMATLQPDPAKPLQNQTIEDFKNEYLRAIQSGDTVPELNMEKSNADTATLSIFGGQRDILSALIEEAGTGDIVQVRGLEDEKLCDSCRPYLDQFLSVSGKSENFESVDSAKGKGWGHINCRCILSPVAEPQMPEKESTEKAVEVVETKSVEISEGKEPKKIVVKVLALPRKPELTEAMKQKAIALAQGKLVYR